MADQIYDQTTIKVTAIGDKKYGLKVVGMVEKFDGWKRLYKKPEVQESTKSTIMYKKKKDRNCLK